jgi:hypothetical protein
MCLDSSFSEPEIFGHISLWIGLRDLKRRNFFEWLDGNDASFTFWGVLEPNEIVDPCACMELSVNTKMYNTIGF